VRARAKQRIDVRPRATVLPPPLRRHRHLLGAPLSDPAVEEYLGLHLAREPLTKIRVQVRMLTRDDDELTSHASS